MGINQMRERVKIYDISESAPDNIGGVKVDRVLVGSFWAKVEHFAGSRVEQNRGVATTTPTQITIRSGSYGITTKNLIEHKNTEYTISSVVVDELKRFTICQVVSR